MPNRYQTTGLHAYLVFLPVMGMLFWGVGCGPASMLEPKQLSTVAGAQAAQEATDVVDLDDNLDNDLDATNPPGDDLGNDDENSVDDGDDDLGDTGQGSGGGSENLGGGNQDDPGDPQAGSACDNGIDDDNDGKIDFPEDPGCSSSEDDSEVDNAGMIFYASPVGAGNHDGGSPQNAMTLADAVVRSKNDNHPHMPMTILLRSNCGGAPCDYGVFNYSGERTAWLVIKSDDASSHNPMFERVGISNPSGQPLDAYIHLDGVNIYTRKGSENGSSNVPLNVSAARRVTVSNSRIHAIVSEPYNPDKLQSNCDRYISGLTGSLGVIHSKPTAIVVSKGSDYFTLTGSMVYNTKIGALLRGSFIKVLNSVFSWLGEDGIKFNADHEHPGEHGQGGNETNIEFVGNIFQYIGDCRSKDSSEPNHFGINKAVHSDGVQFDLSGAKPNAFGFITEGFNHIVFAYNLLLHLRGQGFFMKDIKQSQFIEVFKNISSGVIAADINVEGGRYIELRENNLGGSGFISNQAKDSVAMDNISRHGTIMAVDHPSNFADYNLTNHGITAQGANSCNVFGTKYYVEYAPNGITPALGGKHNLKCNSGVKNPNPCSMSSKGGAVGTTSCWSP